MRQRSRRWPRPGCGATWRGSRRGWGRSGAEAEEEREEDEEVGVAAAAEDLRGAAARVAEDLMERLQQGVLSFGRGLVGVGR